MVTVALISSLAGLFGVCFNSLLTYLGNRQVKTNHGRRAGQHIEDQTDRMERLEGRVDALAAETSGSFRRLDERLIGLTNAVLKERRGA